LPAGVFTLQEAPHDWLFPRTAAVVHHGGAGTTAAGLRAGVPSVVVPFFGDQPFWGQRVAALGAGPPPLPRHRVTPDRLAAAIRRATADPAIRAGAAGLGSRLREEDGVADAVRIIEHRLLRPAGVDLQMQPSN
jgi:sterol 3beta-glucosyltransferase